MAAVESRVFSLEDVDVFTIPHNRMKELLKRVSNQAKRTDYSNHGSFSTLLKELSSSFLEIKQHEEIENKYIMKILKRKLEGEALRKLLIHLHAHSHISDILKQVRNVEQIFESGVCNDLDILGSSLNDAIQGFFEEYVPHMIEEEQVLQPMLMEFLPFHELHQIKKVVLQLHHLKHLEEKQLAIEKSLLTHFEQIQVTVKEETNIEKVVEEEEFIQNVEITSFNVLPDEILTSIFSYLEPQDLCRCAQVSHQWNNIAYTGSFWSVLHPSRWGLGDWTFGKELSSDDCNCDCEPNYDLMTYLNEDRFNDTQSEESDSYGTDSSLDEELDDQVKRENIILHGFSRYVLPRIGDSVKTLVMECSKAVTNGLMFRILSQCKNLEYLDVSQTIISDLGLMGLFKNGCKRLKYLDISGCKHITDKALMKLSLSLGKITNTCASCNCARNKENTSSEVDSNIKIRQLHTLRLSGCYKITDVGLRSLSKYGGLPYLYHLDLSGCFNITSTGIEDLVSKCQNLDMNELFYCDNIVTDSYDNIAGGCQNTDCRNRVCCRTGL